MRETEAQAGDMYTGGGFFVHSAPSSLARARCGGEARALCEGAGCVDLRRERGDLFGERDRGVRGLGPAWRKEGQRRRRESEEEVVRDSRHVGDADQEADGPEASGGEEPSGRRDRRE